MRLFLSYSRQEFYYADSVTAVLQAAGHEVWFDVQQLTPGLDWKEGIARGLHNCDGLLLIASRKSIESPYVASEWQAVQKEGKPVYVLVYEPVVLPPELKPKAVVSGHRRFDHTLRRLRECLENGKTYRDTIPRPNRWNGFPPRIRVIAGILALGTLLSVMAGIIFLASSLMTNPVSAALPRQRLVLHGILFALASIYSFSVLCKLLDRRFTRIEIYAGLMAPTVAFFAPLLYTGDTALPDAAMPLIAWWWALIPALTIIVARYYYRLAVYHWMMRGRVDAETQAFYQQWFGTKPGERRRAKSTNLVLTVDGFQHWLRELSPQGASVPANAQSIRYALHYVPADQKIADQLDATLKHFGHIRVNADDTADQHFMIVSNQTPKSLMAQARNTSQAYTLVLASSTNIDEDALLNYQIVDYRRRSQRQLNAIAAYFADPQAGRQTYGLSHLPQPFDWIVMPRIVSGVTLLMRIAGAFFIALMLVVWLSLLLGVSSVRGFVPQTDVFSLLLYTILGLTGVPLIWLADALPERRIAVRDFNVRAGGLFLVIMATVVLLLLTREAEVSGAIRHMLRSLVESSSSQPFLIALVLAFASIIPALRQLGLWLPTQLDFTIPAAERLVVADLPHIQAGLWNTAILTLLLGALLFL
jgi:hypothetical protein